MAGSRVIPTDVAMSSFAQSNSQTTANVPVMYGEVAKTVTLSGPYNAQQSAGATTDIIQVGADYGIWDYTQNIALDVNSTNFKDPF